MGINTTQAPAAEFRPPSGGQPVVPELLTTSQPPPRPPLNRVDSRSSLPPQSPRSALPLQNQSRPQFQPGGPVTNLPQFTPRPGTPQPRPQLTTASPVSQPPRPQSPQQRPLSQQGYIPQQGPRPTLPHTNLQTHQRAPPPNNLQFGPRQVPQFGALTPDGPKPQLSQQSNGGPKNGVFQGTAPVVGQLPRQPSQGSLKGLDNSNSYQIKSANLDNQNVSNDNKNVSNTENGIEMAGIAKGRSYSIAAAPGTPSPFKIEDDRRKSVSAIGGKIDEIANRTPGLGLIQEGKTDSTDAVRGSRESIRSDISNDGVKEFSERPGSRLTGSKMTTSIMGSLSNINKAKLDDDDDVVLQNHSNVLKNGSESFQQKADVSDRSPSLTRSDDSSEIKLNPVTPAVPNMTNNMISEPQRPKTPKTEPKEELKTDPNKEVKQAITPKKTPSKSPILDKKSPVINEYTNKKPNELQMAKSPSESKSTPRKVVSAPKSRPKDGDNDSGVDESTQGNELNGSPGSPAKKLPSKLPTKEKSSNSLKALSRSSSKSATAKTPDNPAPTEKKKVPMNKIQVGNAPSPNIKTVKSKIGSLENTTYKPGGGRVKIENRKLDFNNAAPKIAAKNEAYTPSGGAKKILSTKLEWNAKSKIGSLQNASYKPGGGDKKIETVKLDFKDKAKPKVASTVNITHKPGGGAVKIENQKLEFKVQSKVGSLDNVKHKPGGGDIKIFDDKEYIKQISNQSPVPDSQSSRQESPVPSNIQPPKSDENLNQQES